MKISMEHFQKQLLRLYAADPSRYTPFALWKMQKMTAEGEAFCLLDWIFVLPEYQGKGAGRFLIDEIIKRSAYRSKVIRVGGETEFYKKCGFYEKERWAWAVKPGFALNEQ
jgi:GNAT superfamily N-acetyltransferase